MKQITLSSRARVNLAVKSAILFRLYVKYTAYSRHSLVCSYQVPYFDRGPTTQPGVLSSQMSICYVGASLSRVWFLGSLVYDMVKKITQFWSRIGYNLPVKWPVYK